MDDTATWQDAKAATQSMELEIARVVPADSIESTDQAETGTLLGCSGGRHQWTGQTVVHLVPGTDAEALVEKVIARFEGRDGFTAAPYTTLDGATVAEIVSSDGEEHYFAGPSAKPDQFEILSASHCFTLPEDVYPGGDF
ncbi:hypothetical protein AB1K54_17160 [Microbacterium sp. BWT-B31]|uniref:hypothetical protein n=1 Tax=Microbacterium sp. BWT-B31 TaxID=3232072 RepID=UPI003528B1DA